MEFHEKLQELRKKRGLTQEELAQDLHVSRTAISKWESGRGYPSIDSLKDISNYFSVTIDDLLSGEKILSLAEKENRSNIRNICESLIGVVDVCALMLIFLPLYPNTVEGFVYSVNLPAYAETTDFNRGAYWMLFVILTAIGVAKILSENLKITKGRKLLTGLSAVMGILAVLFLVLAREAYAAAVAFILLLIKGVTLFRCHDLWKGEWR